MLSEARLSRGLLAASWAATSCCYPRFWAPHSDAHQQGAAVQVLDFNLAKSVHQQGQGWVADTPCGTSPYIAPEVLSHERYSLVRT